jgi:hypothetical protein
MACPVPNPFSADCGPPAVDYCLWTTASGLLPLDHRLWTTASGPPPWTNYCSIELLQHKLTYNGKYKKVARSTI